MRHALFLFSTLAAALAPGFRAAAAEAPRADAASTSAQAKVSYYKNIRPLFQAKCQGCHQPAKAKGDYIMTDFPKLLAGGRDGEAVVPHDVEKSNLLKTITPHDDGKAEMPKNGDPLAKADLELIRRWISEGAVDDTPANARQRVDAEHPPAYALPPVISSLDYSPDGKWLAVSGFHEVILHPANGEGENRRLIGLSEKITSVKFSPDGKWLAVTGGLPARMGEVQVWDVAAGKLSLSVPVTFDTVYGASWSPDSALIAFGCATDKSLRAIDAKSGEQKLFMAGHDDWVLDTCFTTKGDNVVSAGRDMSAKLTELATQRFVDNLTSITPGALKGGLSAIARHPSRDEFIVGGADGVPQVYRAFRQVERRIGDNSNLIRRFPAMEGRLFAVAYSPDGKRILAASSLDGKGHLNTFSANYDSALPDNIKAILAKETAARSAPENAAVEAWQTEGAKLLTTTEFPTGLYAAAFSPDGNTIATSGQDGRIRLLNAADGKISSEFIPVKIDPAAAALAAKAAAADAAAAEAAHASASASSTTAAAPTAPGAEEAAPEKLADGAEVTKLSVEPAAIDFTRPTDFAQLLITATLKDGSTVDVTRIAQIRAADTASEAPTAAPADGLVSISPRGVVHPLRDGGGSLTISLGGKTAAVPVKTSGYSAPLVVDYVHDVTPVLSRLGCNAGTCHGAKDGKAGFKLSLRGYDPVYDLRAFTDDIKGRRTNAASPDDSLMLMKAIAAVPHEGGQVTKPDEDSYRILRSWIADGAKVNFDSAKVTGITLSPQNPTIQREGSRQQFRVIATYADGATRDVTLNAFIDTGNMDVAKAEKAGGLLTALRRGEAPVLARYEGSYASTVLTVMGDRSGFVWEAPPANSPIDELVAAKLERMKTLSSSLCTDLEFIRRVRLDLTGLPPSAEEVRAFIADPRDSRWKREEKIDQLIASSDFTDHWANKWSDLLQVNSKFLGAEGAKLFRDWIRQQVADNVPYDQFVRTILTASGSNKDHPAASYFKILREPVELMENTTHLFLATRFNCNKCHDHPFERWTQDQYYQMAAYFAQVGLERDPASGDANIGGSAVEGAKPLFEKISDKMEGEVKHDRTGKITPPHFPYPATVKAIAPIGANPDTAKPAAAAAAAPTRRIQLADWITSPDNAYFARSFANRLWGYLNGVGLIEPLDDIRAGNPPSNPELLDWLTKDLVDHNFDFRHIVRLVCRSRTYQLSIQTNRWNADDKTNFSHATARRLPAETLLDTIYTVTGTTPNIPGVAAGVRAGQLPDSGIGLKDGFLTNLGRPVRESACECERSSDLQLGPIMALISGPTVGDAISGKDNALTKLTAAHPDDRELVNEVFMRVLNRPATAEESKDALDMLSEMNTEHTALVKARDDRAAEIAPDQKAKTEAREAAIAKAKTDLAETEKALAPALAEKTKEQQTRIAGLEKSITDFDSTLPAKLAAYEADSASRSEWIPLPLTSSVSTNGATLTAQPDGSTLAAGSEGKTVYTLTADLPPGTPLTGLRLEALPDASIPVNGPGRSGGGNFVLTEIEAALQPPGTAESKPLAFADATATFSQGGFDPKAAIDGNKTESANGWAINPHAGATETAVFVLKEAPATGGKLTIQLHQNYADGKHSLGKFRLSRSPQPAPLNFGVPGDLAPILALAPDKRAPQQTAALTAYLQARDPERLKLTADLAAAKMPIPEDPQITARKAAQTTAELPVPPDAKLERLKHDTDLSAAQLQTHRLTATQDLTWALINTPAFLFNH